MAHDSIAVRSRQPAPAIKWLLALLILLSTAVTPAGAEAPDLEAARTAVKAADLAFAKAVAARDRELFASFIAEDATFLGGGLTQGRDAIVVDWAIFFAVGGDATITWEPHTVEVAASGDLAYTLGTFEVSAPGPDGRPRRSSGTYVSIWRKHPDGLWKVVVDGGTPPQPVGVEQ